MEKTNQTPKTPEILHWKAPSHEAHQRSGSWYLIFAIISVGLMAFAIYDRSIITIITFALIILMIFVISTQAPREITCKITKTGISLGNTLYPYKTIKTFWIMYNPPEIKTLNFETTAYINNTIIVQLGNQDPVTVKLALSQYLLEDLNREESATDALARRLKI